MSFPGNIDSKYALANFNPPARGQQKLKRLALVGGGVMVLWMGTIGVVAAKRYSRAQPPVAATVAPAAPEVAVVPPVPVVPPAPAAPPASEVPVPSAPVAAESPADAARASQSKASRSSRKTSRSARARRTSHKRYAATSTTRSGSSAQARMKDDQLDALLKQFK